MTAFSKPALTTDQQIDLLIRRGMQVADRDRARLCLNHVNYYRLRAYWLPFEVPAADGEHGFAPGTGFDAVMAIYEFDRELRLLLLDAIERIEISLRTRWANELGLRYGAFAHEQPEHFMRQHLWQQSLDELNKEFSRSREGELDYYAAWVWRNGTQPLSMDTMTTADIANASLYRNEDWWRQLQRRGQTLRHDPFYGGGNSLHLGSVHDVGIDPVDPRHPASGQGASACGADCQPAHDLAHRSCVTWQ